MNLRDCGVAEARFAELGPPNVTAIRSWRSHNAASGGVETWHGEAIEAPANERAGLG